MKKSIINIIIISSLIIPITIVGCTENKIIHKDTNIDDEVVVSDNLITPIENNVQFTNTISNKPLSLLEKARKAKGGIIGTSGKGVVALRFDDYQNVFREKIYPLLVERGLPSSMALISRFNTEQPWGIGTTWDDIREWNRNGLEIWSHGTDHKDYSKDGDSGLYSQIVTSKEEIEENDIKVVGWVLPGVEPTTSNLPYNGLTKPSDYDSPAGKLIMDTYALTEAYAYGQERTLPNYIYHGLNHVTVSDGGETLSSSIEKIDAAIKNKSGIELMCHPGNLGQPGNLTFEEFEELLNYIKAKWDEGELEVLTPSGLFFANPYISNRLKLTTDDSFEDLTISNPGSWNETKNWTGKSIKTSKGKTGDNFLRIGSNSDDSGVTQKIIDLDKLGVQGEQFVFEGWFKAYDSEGTEGMIQISDYDDPSNLKIVKNVVSKDKNWTRVRFVFSIPPNTKNITLSLYNVTGSTIDWDDISIKII